MGGRCLDGFIEEVVEGPGERGNGRGGGGGGWRRAEEEVWPCELGRPLRDLWRRTGRLGRREGGGGQSLGSEKRGKAFEAKKEGKQEGKKLTSWKRSTSYWS